MVRDRLSGMSLTTVANQYGISRALVCRLVNESKAPVVELARRLNCDIATSEQ